MDDMFCIKEGRFGRGVFAERDIKKYEHILIFFGPIISHQQTVVYVNGDPLQIGADAYINLEEPGVLVNHSCAPNAGIVDDTTLIAIAPIKKGEEIFYDYSTTMDEHDWTMQCVCNRANCRGVITDFALLSPELQRTYLNEGIVQRFIARQYN